MCVCVCFCPLAANKEETILWETSCFSKWELIIRSVWNIYRYCNKVRFTNSMFIYLCVCLGSPYLSSLNMNSRRAAVAAWRLPRTSLGDTRGDAPGESVSARSTSLSNGHHGRQHINTTDSISPHQRSLYRSNGKRDDFLFSQSMVCSLVLPQLPPVSLGNW